MNEGPGLFMTAPESRYFIIYFITDGSRNAVNLYFRLNQIAANIRPIISDQTAAPRHSDGVVQQRLSQLQLRLPILPE